MTETNQNFETAFFFKDREQTLRPRRLIIPTYQRSYSWEQKQIELFIADLTKGGRPGSYYYGHFIAEGCWEQESTWQLVDGQQRVTTAVLFLAACRLYASGLNHPAFMLLGAFSTVSFDQSVFERLLFLSDEELSKIRALPKSKDPSQAELRNSLGIEVSDYTTSQGRMILAIRDFDASFRDPSSGLNPIDIVKYLNTLMQAHCSLHLTQDKAVAVNIFEMHNTRGVALTTLEIVKAKLMKFAYDQGGEEAEKTVQKIQEEFGAINRLEERVATQSFRGDLTMNQLLNLHLRVVNAGEKKGEQELDQPPLGVTTERMVSYIEEHLVQEGVAYALGLAKQFRLSCEIIVEQLPQWDQGSPLVGDTVILNRSASYQFFLLACRLFLPSSTTISGRVDDAFLEKWERFLFTQDFHYQYHGLGRHLRDRFHLIFQECIEKPGGIEPILDWYLENGFRSWDRTRDLQALVANFVSEHKKTILTQAFGWHHQLKLNYVLYKYECSQNANIRSIMKGSISVEHVLPQNWREDALESLPDDCSSDEFVEEVRNHINGLGNLMLLTLAENSSAGNKHPADKIYQTPGGSYAEHNDNRERWRDPTQWVTHIQKRGEEIYQGVFPLLIPLLGSRAETSRQ